MSQTVLVNGKNYAVDVEPDTPLLWVIRDAVGLKGTKFGCGAGVCGACTVHADGAVIRSCSVPIGDVQGMAITTIEGVGQAGRPHPVQEAWIESQAPQCGYCQTGMIMATIAMLKDLAEPTDAQINEQITNICRCGTYPRIRKAIHLAARKTKQQGS